MTSGYERSRAAVLLPFRHGVHIAAEYRIDDAGTGRQTRHFQRLQRPLASGQLILAGPTLGAVNTGLVIFDAPDEQAARHVMEEDPVVHGGYARGEVRPFRVSLLRGRD